MSKPKKEKASGNEKFLKNVGEAQINASQMFEGAHQAILREAQADHSNRLRGRMAGDTWKQLGGGLDANAMALGDSRRHDGYAELTTGALGGSLREGTNRATELSDALVQEGAGARLSNAQVSGKSLQRAARQEDAVSSAKTQLANQWKNELTSAGVTLAAAGMDMYSKKKPEVKPSNVSTLSPQANALYTGESWRYNPNQSLVTPQPANPFKKLYGP